MVLGKKKSGDKKPGCNTHFHFIAGRKTRDEKNKLSPNSNHINTKKGAVTGGFSRDVFKERAENLFDTQFCYNRPLEETYHYLKHVKLGKPPEDRIRSVLQSADKSHSLLRYDQLPSEEKQKKLDALMNYIQHGKTEGKSSGMSLNKSVIHKQAQELKYNGDVYKSLLNMNYRLKNGFQPTSDLTPYIMQYAKFVNAPYKVLPNSLKEDRLVRFGQVINRKLPKGNKLDGENLLAIEKQANFNGKVYSAMGQLNNKINNNETFTDAHSAILDIINKNNSPRSFAESESLKSGNVGSSIEISSSLSSLFKTELSNNHSESYKEEKNNRMRNKRKPRNKI